jgi:hypothetical protein
MLDKEANNIDAVIVATPDHMHGIAAMWCMERKKHVYVQKPLVRTVWEARQLRAAAAKYGVATQMGNQGYSNEGTRQAAEMIWSGEIGSVAEVHAWSDRPLWPQGLTEIPREEPAPSTLNWDLWLGVAEKRPYTAGGMKEPNRWGGYFYEPFNWRGFYDFGSSLIGDWGVHILGPANWALQLSPESLVSVECIRKTDLPPFTFPEELVLKYEFAARPGMPPVSVFWYQQGGPDAYTPPGMTPEQARKIPGQGPQVGPPQVQRATPAIAPPSGRSGYNLIMAGTKGYLGTSGRGEGVGLLPGARWAEYKLPQPYLTRSPGASTGNNGSAHCRDWIRACKGGAVACSNFSLAAPYTEWLVLGSAAIHYEGKLLWDNARGEFSNNKDANKWVKPAYRKGWEIRL